MKLGDCEVWVACDGEPLPEYSVAPEGDDGKQIACFIPSEAGKVKIFVFNQTELLLILCLMLFHRSSSFTSGTIVERIPCASKRYWTGHRQVTTGLPLVCRPNLGAFVSHRHPGVPINFLI